jgi:serine/threonine protein kinase
MTSSEKLHISLSMAQTLADLHNYDGGKTVDADMDIEQWLLAMDGTVKLNDLNTAHARENNTGTRQYCAKEGKPDSGLGRSMEELIGAEQDESVDTFVFGNNLYTLLTGFCFHYENGDK